MKPLLLQKRLVAACIAAVAGGAHAAEINSGAADRNAVALTVYETDGAVVSERRSVSLPAGASQLALADVAEQLQPQTVRLEGTGLRVIESRLAYDLLTPDSLLQRLVGKDVDLLRTHPTTGEDIVAKGRLLSVAGGVPVVRVNGRVEYGGPWRVAVADLPDGLRERPTLIAQVDSKSAGVQPLHLVYLTGGLSWSADYVGEYNDAASTLELTGLASVVNNSGASYDDARLRIVSGQVNRVAPQPVPMPMLKRGMVAAEAMASDGAAQVEAFEYYGYDFERPITLKDHETKQLPLLPASVIKVKREYRLDSSQGIGWRYLPGGEQRASAAVVLMFKNELGRPLPRGSVRVYGEEGGAAGEGIVQLLGEDQLPHTPQNEEVTLNLGQAFDVTAKRTQLRQQNLAENRYQATWQLRVRNAKKRDAAVRVIEPMPGEWKIEKASHEHKRLDANRAEWTLNVPAGGETVLEYTVAWR